MNNRRKGHDLERQVVNDLKEIFPYAKTSRATSKLMDDCGIDITGTPLLIQCKRGYQKNRPKFEQERDTVNERLKRNFPKEHPIHNLPYLLVQKLDSGNGNKRLPHYTYVTMEYDFLLWLINNIDKEKYENLPLVGI